MLRVINNDDGWLKRLFLSDPGTLEEIQERVAKQLDSIEPPPEYNNKYVDLAALSGFRVGFEDGKFEVEDKLYLIDVGVTLIEFAVLEIATAGVGGVAATAARAGVKAAKVATSAGSKALVAAMNRLENVPIFIPVATGGVGTYVTVGKVIKAARTSASKKLADAMIKAGIKRPEGTDAHHIVAIGHRLAQKSREILAEFGVKLDQAENGAFLPSNLKSPNPKGAIVHATLANKRLYYEIVEEALRKAKSQQDVLRILKRIRQTLEDGTFYHARL
jgi:A nuclease family of the HNH/ENDO VII superfamily with conserved AHH